MKVVVVGAGLVGLSAADELRRSGAEVVVLEARDRVGGRVWSRRLENGAVVEMGAEFILSAAPLAGQSIRPARFPDLDGAHRPCQVIREPRAKRPVLGGSSPSATASWPWPSRCWC